MGLVSEVVMHHVTAEGSTVFEPLPVLTLKLGKYSVIINIVSENKLAHALRHCSSLPLSRRSRCYQHDQPSAAPRFMQIGCIGLSK